MASGTPVSSPGAQRVTSPPAAQTPPAAIAQPASSPSVTTSAPRPAEPVESRTSGVQASIDARKSSRPVPTENPASGARDNRHPPRDPPTALEMLESARQRGTILASEAEEDSLRALDRQRRSRSDDARDARRLSSAEKNAIRDSLRDLDKTRTRDRNARLNEETYRYAVRRDSALAAMRQRDSLATVARAIERFNEQERQDSLRALRTPPKLDARIPVGGRSAHVSEPSGDRPSERQDEGCYCNVEGTVEVRSNRPLSSPFGVSVMVRGRPSLRDRVLLFMGSPREFVIGRVPCGTRYLDVLPEPGRPYVVERNSTLGPFDCAAGTLRQIRIVLVPR